MNNQEQDDLIMTDQSYDIQEMIKNDNKYSEILTDEDEAEEDVLKNIDLSKLENQGVRQMGNDVVICRDLS
jgi:hypothetical protein